MANNECSDEDKALFQSQMKGVLPLRETKIKANIKLDKPKPKVRPKEQYAPPAAVQALNISNPYTLSLHADCVMSHGKTALATKQYKSLKQGLITVQKRLDLHGLTIDRAREALSLFITQCFSQNLRYVLIIHGKGGQDFNAPRLKNHVNHWLTQYPHVLAFHSAQPKDGGTGAVYVVLKSNLNGRMTYS